MRLHWRILVFLEIIVLAQSVERFQPNWNSLDQRTLPKWYDEAKVGIFIHWGVFSVPSFVSEWFWWYWQGEKPWPSVVEFMEKNYPPGWTYADFGRDFTAEFYNATEWTELFEASGARYVVLTTKHHEGFTLWPSATSFNWNSMQLGSRRDLVGELEQAVRANGNLRYGVYHSLFEWFNPVWNEDKKNNFTTTTYSRTKAQPELYDLVHRYKPDLIWSDGDPAPDTYWNSTHFLAWLYSESPVRDNVVVNDRWGDGTSCKHGDFYNCADRYDPGFSLPHKWENAFTIDKSSWGYRRTLTMTSVMSTEEILQTIVKTIACNGNALINIGPRKDGTIPAIFQERLRQMGQWLKINDEAVYASRPWTSVNDTEESSVWYTQSSDGEYLYAHISRWPLNDILELKNVNSTLSLSEVVMLGTDLSPIKFELTKNHGLFLLNQLLPNDPARWIWVLKMKLG